MSAATGPSAPQVGGRQPNQPPSRLRAFVDELARAGIREAVVCPGSRSTPLALALRAHDRIRVRVLLDERSAGFYALGIARTSRRPVVLLATSGTAVVNFAPAVVEASLARVPLLVLTADRPAELRDRGAPQAIDQDHLYGRHAKWFAEVALDDDAPDAMAHVRAIAGRAVATALAGPAGPVHLNLPLREPLIPAEDLGAIGGDEAHDPHDAPPAPFADALVGRRTLAAAEIDALAAGLARTERGLIVAGPMDEPDAIEPIARLAAATGYPILADPLSGLRAGGHDRAMVLAHADHLTRPGAWIDAHLPQLVIRFGAMPTSKPVTEMLRRAAPELLVVDGDGGWRESAIVATTFLHADAGLLAAALAESLGQVRPAGPGAWTADWLAAEGAADRALRAWLDGLAEPFEGAPFPALGELLPSGAVLWAGNSMPVRDLDAWLRGGERALRILGNRGANGIDGVVSTALGSAAVAGGKVVLVVGDVSFLHDLGALVTARLQPSDLLVIVIENDGGGIFSLLPQARTVAPGVGLPAHYEELFGTQHGIQLGPIVEAFGFPYHAVRASGSADVRRAIESELAPPGLRVLSIRSDRARNAALHAAAAAAVSGALADLAGVRQ
jgi:2-succinyl-5-enolpyruvyl-6-hydroxy-3-cyclohexene-1-carboxylate synthase